jgi:hypothetical protein
LAQVTRGNGRAPEIPPLRGSSGCRPSAIVTVGQNHCFAQLRASGLLDEQVVGGWLTAMAGREHCSNRMSRRSWNDVCRCRVVGKSLLDRKPELLEALQRASEREGFHLDALMVSDVPSRGRDLLIAGDAAAVAGALAADLRDGEIALPGVMGRKQQVAPELLALPVDAIGAVYRHFPKRKALLKALYVDEVEELCRSGALCCGLPAGPAFPSASAAAPSK